MSLPDGSTLVQGHPGPGPLDLGSHAEIRVRREAFFRKCFWAGDIGFAESFIDGDWDTPNLTAVIGFFISNLEDVYGLSGSKRASSPGFNLLRLVNRLGQWIRPNTPANARRNIREHYDLSNDFFALWLDPSLMYSSAKWPADQPQLSLEGAQEEKNEALCRHLRLRPEDHVLEVGTGWGGWALHAARRYGCRVTTVTISQQQYELARTRIANAGLAGRVDVKLLDFREIEGRFDKIVSIEMMEALGHRFQPEFARVVSRLLKPDGILALQYITCPDARYEGLRRGVDFIQKHIFPGSLLLSINRVNSLLAEAGGFTLHQLEDFGPDYARTLRIWHDRFLDRHREVSQLGFDDRFVRKWNYYLSYCEAAFARRNISVVHAVYSRPNNLSL